MALSELSHFFRTGEAAASMCFNPRMVGPQQSTNTGLAGLICRLRKDMLGCVPIVVKRKITEEARSEIIVI